MQQTATSRALWAGVEAYDAEAVDRELKGLLEGLPLSRAVTEVILPFLQEVGDRWEHGSLSVAQEHFFTGLLTRRLTALASEMPVPDDGPVVVLACPPGERHEMVLLCFGLLVGERGAKVRYLGADTPIPAIVGAVRASGADALVLAATRSTALEAGATALGKLGERHRVYVAGRGADEEVARVVGGEVLPADPVAAAEALLARP